MKQIIKVNEQKNVGYVENVTYIRKQENGSFGLCSENEAEGVIYNDIIYQLYDRGNKIEGDTVIVIDVDLGTILERMNISNSIAFVTLAEENKIDDVTAAEHTDLFNEFKVGVTYNVGNIRKYNNKLYKCLSAHTSQSDWTPDLAVSLWKEISDPSEKYPAWSQPVGAFDCYMKGDKVTYNDSKYISLVDNNVWLPDVYGWQLVESEV